MQHIGFVSLNPMMKDFAPSLGYSNSSHYSFPCNPQYELENLGYFSYRLGILLRYYALIPHPLPT
ncbi:MAG: hypothetical protein KDD62_16520, partial [Bdellovibrionales bacterium]|nr:hypothetical protein [Bdellovibrionales bacterium]